LPGTLGVTGLTTLTGGLTTPKTGAASTSAVTLTGTPYTAGSGTTNFPLFYMNDGTAPTTWSANGTQFGINTVSGFTGNMMDFHINGGYSIFSVNYQGNGLFAGTLGVTGHVTVEGVTSTGATGTGKFVFDTAPTLGSTTVSNLTDSGLTASKMTCSDGSKVLTSTCTNLVTATELAAQYSKGSCTEVWGGSGTSFAMQSGDDAISNNTCYNDSGVTRTITAVKCRSDNAANTTTVNPTFGSAGTGTTILSGALTCGNSYAYSSSGTVSNGSWTTGTGIDPGMATVGNATSIAVIIEYTY